MMILSLQRMILNLILQIIPLVVSVSLALILFISIVTGPS